MTRRGCLASLMALAAAPLVRDRRLWALGGLVTPPPVTIVPTTPGDPDWYVVHAYYKWTTDGGVTWRDAGLSRHLLTDAASAGGIMARLRRDPHVRRLEAERI